MQDIHWYTVYWGYFPCYALGATIAAQFFDTAERALPDLSADIAQGDFTALMRWLNTHVHHQGARRPMMDIIHQATGKELDPAIFRQHLVRQYLGT